MWDALEALTAPFLMLLVFVAVAVAAFRATDGARRGGKDEGDR